MTRNAIEKRKEFLHKQLEFVAEEIYIHYNSVDHEHVNYLYDELEYLQWELRNLGVDE